MIKSMTGFGRAQRTLHERDITVEARAVNHRYLELSVRAPRSMSFIEERLRAYVMKLVSRGKVEVNVQVRQPGKKGLVIAPDIAVAEGYFNALKEISLRLGTDFDIGTSVFSRFDDVFSVDAQQLDEEELFSDIKAVAEEALAGFCEARTSEGARMKDDILSRLLDIEEIVEAIESASPEQIERYRERLWQRMKSVLESVDIDENRILLEAALYADKSAVDEETVRLKSHIARFRDILSSSDPVGRQLDFMVQEINREINTIGSKSGNVEMTAKVVDAKAQLEKIREQIQNIE